jgi:beta-lactamase class A
MLSRRAFVVLTALCVPAWLRAAPQRFGSLPKVLAQLENTNGGRLGVAVLDTGSGERAGYRAHERFPMCSTFKFLLVAAVLERADRHEERLARSLAIPPKPLLSHSSLTERHAGGTLSIAELCRAVLTQSDNSAANLLLETVGGPAGITRFARTIGDEVTRLDRTEPALNEALAGDPRDTTSPEAMAGDLRAVLLGELLTGASRAQLTAWMQASVTGLDRLRARLPASWRALDKTGSNGEHTSNDIAVFWPPGQPPVIVTAYITQCFGPDGKRAAMLAEIGRLVVAALSI